MCIYWTAIHILNKLSLLCNDLFFFFIWTKLLGRERGPFLFTVLPWFTYLQNKYNGTAKDAQLVNRRRLLAAMNFKFKSYFLALTVKDFPFCRCLDVTFG